MGKVVFWTDGDGLRSIYTDIPDLQAFMIDTSWEDPEAMLSGPFVVGSAPGVAPLSQLPDDFAEILAPEDIQSILR